MNPKILWLIFLALLIKSRSIFIHLRDEDYKYTTPPPNLIPYYSSTTYEDKNSFLYSLYNSFDREFLLLVSKTLISNIHYFDPRLYISNDGGLTLRAHQIKVDGNPIFITDVIPIKNYMFCMSSMNNTFLYMDREFNEMYFQTFEEDAQMSPHQFYASYILKLVPQPHNLIVS
ncbi:hypothetical protein RF11_10525 [Thelohanellus kitauei]|uniref:Uncharacterized protein n=1 Tax=Thelohanellus kitauei TaxID=669202 RepID=A0A0C2MG55_THEKT|nr:hypothetical protein RF11_10525 [Thelohanellus kitauei]